MFADLPDVIQERVGAVKAANLCHRIAALHQSYTEQPQRFHIPVDRKHQISQSAPDRRFIALSAFTAHITQCIIHAKGILPGTTVHILKSVSIQYGAFRCLDLKSQEA